MRLNKKNVQAYNDGERLKHTWHVESPESTPIRLTGAQIVENEYVNVVTRGNYKGTEWENHNCMDGTSWSNASGTWEVRDWEVRGDTICVIDSKKRCYAIYQDMADVNKSYFRSTDGKVNGEKMKYPDEQATRCAA